MTIPYHVAEPIIGAAAREIDRLNALLGESVGAKSSVNFTGDGLRYHVSAQARRDGKGGLACTVCKRPGHVAKDCLVFMETEGVRKRWFMHDCMHKWEKGCEYPNCKYKHDRPTKTPEEASAATTAQCNATTTRALPTELTLADLVALRDTSTSMSINTTSVYISRNGFWMQPEVDA